MALTSTHIVVLGTTLGYGDVLIMCIFQIWFQNARARSKKRRSSNSNSDANSDGMGK